MRRARPSGTRALSRFAAWLRQHLRPRDATRNMWSLLVTLGVVMGLWQGATWFKERYFDPPTRMTGEFNVAVAEFGVIAEDGDVVAADAGFDLANNFTKDLSSQLSELGGPSIPVVFAIRGPTDVGRIQGSTQNDRALYVAELAEAINADVVIYGNIRSGITSNFQPEFYIRADRFVEGSELAAQHGLGTPIQVEGDLTRPGFAAILREELQVRVEAMAEFVVGLAWYVRTDYEEAMTHFANAASDSSGWPAEDGKEVAYLFLGNVQGILGDLKGAETSYNNALDLTGNGYWRALLGLAEIKFQRSRGECSPQTVDVLGLAAAKRGFENARNAAIKPTPVSLLVSGSDFGVARVLQCLAHTGDPQLAGGDIATLRADAIRFYEHVIAAFQTTDPPVRTVSLQERAAEAFAGIGYILLTETPKGTDDVRFNREEAATLLTQAAQLTIRPAREAVMLRLLGFTQSRLDRCSEALESYDQSLELLADQTAANYQVERDSIAESLNTTGHCDAIDFDLLSGTP